MGKARLKTAAANEARQKQLKGRATTGEIMNVSEAARILGVGAATVRRWVEEGKLPCQMTPGGYRIFAQSEVSALKQRRDEEAVAG